MRNRRVLLVEDDPTTSYALLAILQRKGFEVSLATTVSQAQVMLGLNPGIVILDLMLPDGDGTAILKHIRASNLPIRVMVTTGIGDPQRLSTITQFKPELLLKKPIDLPELLRTIESAN